MKTSIAIVLFLIIPSLTYSQGTPSYVALKSGISIPTGKYHSKTLDGGSFALTGLRVSLEGAWFFHKGLGAGLSAGYSAHPVDVGSLAAEKVAESPFLQELVIRSDPYRVITLAGFVHYSFKIGKQISLTPRAGGGMIYGFSPYQLYKPVYFMVDPKWYEITSARDLGPYIETGVMFRYTVCQCLEILVDVDYSYGALTYGFITGTGETREEDHRVMTMDCLAGIAVTF